MKHGKALGSSALMTAALAAVLFWPRRAEATIEPDVRGGSSPGLPMGDLPSPSDLEPSFIDYDSIGADGAPLPGFTMDEFAALTDEQKINAFLYMIRSCEHVFPRDVVSGDCYRIFYGGGFFNNLSDHPVNTGEMKGIPLPAAMCVAAGYADGVCVSTAAGAYQLIRPTWNRVREAGAWGPRLPDFSPDNQDEAARRLLSESGALGYLTSGQVQKAVSRASALWASLPGSSAGQGPKSATFALTRFTEGLRAA